jgi:hypothetical protein
MPEEKRHQLIEKAEQYLISIGECAGQRNHSEQ